MIPLKIPRMQGVLSVLRSDLSVCNAQAGEEIEVTQRMEYFHQK